MSQEIQLKSFKKQLAVPSLTPYLNFTYQGRASQDAVESPIEGETRELTPHL